MGVSGIGTSSTYLYDATTGKLSTKDGTKNNFVDYLMAISSERKVVLLAREASRAVVPVQCGVTTVIIYRILQCEGLCREKQRGEIGTL